MTYWTPIGIGIIFMVAMLLPAAFLVYAAVVIARRLRGTPTKQLVAGSILLAIASLNSIFNYFGAYFLDPQIMTSIIVFASLIFQGLNFIALILIGIGLIGLSRSIAPGTTPG